jgi:hypothetical protein
MGDGRWGFSSLKNLIIRVPGKYDDRVSRYFLVRGNGVRLSFLEFER